MTARDPLHAALSQELQATERHAGQLARVTAIVRVLLPHIVEALDDKGVVEFVVRIERGRVVEPLLWRERKKAG